MPSDRFFFDAPFQEGSLIALPQDEAHHLINVMRVQMGEIIEIVNGKNQLALAKLEEKSKKAAKLLLIKVSNYPEEKRKIILAQGLPRLNRLEMIVEKSIELGASEIWLFPADLSEKKELNENQRARLHNISIAAMKQCGRFFLPPICFKPPLKNWEKKDLATFSFFGDTSPNALPLKNYLTDIPETCVFFIGPEAGLSSSEETLLKKNGSIGVKLHNNILRTDTAPITALSIIQHFLI